MKIIEIDSTRLGIQLTPIAIWLFGSVFAVIGLAVLIGLGTCVSIECSRTDKEAGICRLTTSYIFGSYQKNIPVDTIRRAEVETYYDSDGDTHKVVLITTTEKIPFSTSSSSGYTAKEQLAKQINGFLENKNTTSIKAGQDDRLIGYLVGGLFFLVGSCIVIFTCQYNLLFDKTENKLTLFRKSLLRKSLSFYNLNEIKEAVVDLSTDSDGTTYRTILLLTTGEIVPLSTYYSSGKADKEKLAQAINKFLKS